MKYKVVIQQGREEEHCTEVPALPGCFSQEEALGEVKANIRRTLFFESLFNLSLITLPSFVISK
ncbi:MAG: type II toxin-antitoxin system HicB family antitoxin [Euryarchaeota archaeon]|nr:type II toxin-antitoxin system HicB family antitoxin [Euryarchaeota archaeon]